MDTAKHLRGRTGATVPVNGSKSPEIRSCGYCKAKFEVSPLVPHKKFCCDTHRKLAHRYGSLSIGKVAERMMRDVRKMVEAELKPLRARVEAIERELSEARAESSRALYMLTQQTSADLRARVAELERFAVDLSHSDDISAGAWVPSEMETRVQEEKDRASADIRARAKEWEHKREAAGSERTA